MIEFNDAPAPKDGSRILALFESLPYPTMAVWNDKRNCWMACIHCYHCDTLTLEPDPDDPCWEDEQIQDTELTQWAQMPQE